MGADTKQAATSWLQILDIDPFYAALQVHTPLKDQCLNANSDYMESEIYKSAAHCVVYTKVRIQFLASCVSHLIFETPF